MVLLTFINCATNKNSSINENGNTERRIAKSFGSFALPDDWIEVSETPSAGGFYYYFHKSQIFENMPTNVSITMTTNNYNKNELTELGREISKLLTAEGRAIIYTQEAVTKQGYPLLIYTTEDTAPQAVKTTNMQFYIADDKKHVLINLHDFHHVEVTDAEKAARYIADSFVWLK
jgi:hypothetical protein